MAFTFQPRHVRGDDPVALAYHVAAYDSGVVGASTTWLGVPIEKFPTDLAAYQEILNEVRPDLLVETGTSLGGSALFFASIMDLVGHGHVLTLDVVARPVPAHPRVSYAVVPSSTHPEVVAGVAERAKGARTMVVLDSDHREAHVMSELLAYAPLVTPGSYLVVEDTNVNGRPVAASYGPGAGEAVEAFLKSDAGRGFVQDWHRERYGVTFNPGGWLRRVR